MTIPQQTLSAPAVLEACMNADVTAAFAKGLRGPLIQPAHADDDDARALDPCRRRR